MSDDLAGRIMAHAFHDELEKLAISAGHIHRAGKGRLEGIAEGNLRGRRLYSEHSKGQAREATAVQLKRMKGKRRGYDKPMLGGRGAKDLEHLSRPGSAKELNTQRERQGDAIEGLLEKARK